MRGVSQIGRSVLLAVMIVCSLSVSGTSSAASRDDGLTINVFYSATSLQAKLSNGTALNSGAVVPPGPYSVVVYDSGADPNPAFAMSGPGASVSSDLNPDGTGIEVPMTFGPFVFQPSSSYAISDSNMGDGAGITFATAATGSSITAGSSGSSASSGSGAASGGAAAKELGALALTVGKSRKPIFTFESKPVKTLKAGKYLLIVGDFSKTASALIGHGTARPSMFSSATAVGTTSHTLDLTPGKWFIQSSESGPKAYFTVT